MNWLTVTLHLKSPFLCFRTMELVTTIERVCEADAAYFQWVATKEDECLQVHVRTIHSLAGIQTQVTDFLRRHHFVKILVEDVVYAMCAGVSESNVKAYILARRIYLADTDAKVPMVEKIKPVYNAQHFVAGRAIYVDPLVLATVPPW